MNAGTFRNQRFRRRGAIIVLAAVLLVVILMILAFSIDLGVIQLERNRLQRTADAAALAGAARLCPSPIPRPPITVPINLPFLRFNEPAQDQSGAIAEICALAAVNHTEAGAAAQIFQVDRGDIRFHDYQSPISVAPPTVLPQILTPVLDALALLPPSKAFSNSVEVTVRRGRGVNSELSLFFARVWNVRSVPAEASARAAIVQGYGVRPTARLLPLALDVTIWQALRMGNSAVNAIDIDVGPLDLEGNKITILDRVTWDPDRNEVTSGADGIWEVVAFADPLGNAGLPKLPALPLGLKTNKAPEAVGNLVSLDLGQSAGGPGSDQLCRQIQEGPSAADFRSGRLADQTPDNVLWLPFRVTGHRTIPDDCYAALADIIGKPSILPLYATIDGAISGVKPVLGGSGDYYIVGWAAVVVTSVHAKGQLRYVTVQPAVYLNSRVARGSIKSLALSDGVYSGPFLVE
jgi:hypothetical protein